VIYIIREVMAAVALLKLQ